jgi:capsular polysaccharide biosynthesis protein
MNAATPELYRALWRHRLTILVMTVLAAGTAYYQSSQSQKVYRASTLIRIEQPSSSSDPQQLGDALGVAQHLAQTYARIVSTEAIASRVHASLGSKGAHDEISINGAPVQDLELMYINAESHNPSVAAAAANATPVVLRKFIAATGGVRDKVVTINPAAVPASPVSPRPTRTALLALILALIVNAGLVLLFEFLRDRLPEPDEIEEAFGKPVLATFPKLELNQGSVRAKFPHNVASVPQAHSAKETA